MNRLLSWRSISLAATSMCWSMTASRSAPLISTVRFTDSRVVYQLLMLHRHGREGWRVERRRSQNLVAFQVEALPPAPDLVLSNERILIVLLPQMDEHERLATDLQDAVCLRDQRARVVCVVE